MTVCTPWATAADLPGKYAALVCSSELDDWLRIASTVLYDFTGRRWRGECDDTVRPVAMNRGCVCRIIPSTGGELPLERWARHGGCCRCGGVEEVILPNGPVREVLHVLVDGEALEPDAYRIDNGRSLVRLDGLSWPCCQYEGRASSEPGTWEVWYSYGADPPPEAVMFAAILGAELWKGANEIEGCRLPANTQTVSRQGVSITVYNPEALFPQGIIGIPEIDLWLGSMNYAKKQGAGLRTMVPGASARFRRTDTTSATGS